MNLVKHFHFYFVCFLDKIPSTECTNHFTFLCIRFEFGTILLSPLGDCCLTARNPCWHRGAFWPDNICSSCKQQCSNSGQLTKGPPSSPFISHIRRGTPLPTGGQSVSRSHLTDRRLAPRSSSAKTHRTLFFLSFDVMSSKQRTSTTHRLTS